MRIVAGVARGRQLQAPRGTTTRPTSDRVREAAFSTLHARVGTWTGVRVLDLFAGSGALGLEALSRGAHSVVFVESHRGVIQTLRANVERVGLPGSQVVLSDVATFARHPPCQGRVDESRHPFDVVLCDPPYALPAAQVADVLADLLRLDWLAKDCVLVVERDARDQEPPWPEAPRLLDCSHIAAVDRRVYGDTALWYGHLVERADDAPVARDGRRGGDANSGMPRIL